MADLTNFDGMCRVHQSASITQINTGVGLHIVQLDATDWDPDNCWTPNIGGTPWRYTAPSDGYYQINARIGATGTNSGDCMQARVQKLHSALAGWVDIIRGAKQTITAQDVTNNTTALVSVATDLQFLQQGDFVQLSEDILQIGGTGFTIITGSDKTFFSIIRLI